MPTCKETHSSNIAMHLAGPIRFCIFYWDVWNVFGNYPLTGSFFRCGTNYELYIVAVNDFGESAPSKTVKGRTGGKPPRPPVLDDLILTNTTWVALNLGSWDDGLCPGFEKSFISRI